MIQRKFWICICIISLFFVVLICFFAVYSYLTVSQISISFGNIIRGEEQQYVPGLDGLKSYLSQCFCVDLKNFNITDVLRDSYYVSESDIMNEIISAMQSAEYHSTEIVADDYEYVNISFDRRNGSVKDRIVLAYRFSDKQLYAFYNEQGYFVTQYETLRQMVGNLIDLPAEKHLPGKNEYRYERFFYKDTKQSLKSFPSIRRICFFGIKDNYLVIEKNFHVISQLDEVTKETIAQAALDEIFSRTDIYFSRNELKKYESANECNVYYDKFTDTWMATWTIYYPNTVTGEDGHEYEGVGVWYIDVFLNGDGIPFMIYDEARILERFAK